MNREILISLVAAVLNMVLSSVVPTLTKKSEEELVVQIRKVFENNRQVIITSSIIIGVTTYISLKLAQEIESSDFLTETPRMRNPILFTFEPSLAALSKL
jgi:hypothetical protein